MREQHGFTVVEYAIVIAGLTLVTVGAFDVINTLRCRSTLKEATALAVAHYTRSAGTESNIEQATVSAVELAKTEIRVAFPSVSFGCSVSQKNCSLIELSTPATPSDPVVVSAQLRLPTYLLSQEGILLEAESSGYVEQSLLPTEGMDIVHN